MKYLSDYLNKPIENLLKKYDAFFVFSNKQLNEARA